jgi:hypothetical protein
VVAAVLARVLTALAEVALVADSRWAAVTLAILGAGSATLAADLATDVSANLDLASMDTRAGPTPTTAMAPVRCPLLSVMPGLATNIQHRNLPIALHPQMGAARWPTLEPATRPLPYAARDGHSATYGDVTPRMLAFIGRRARELIN